MKKLVLLVVIGFSFITTKAQNFVNIYTKKIVNVDSIICNNKLPDDELKVSVPKKSRTELFEIKVTKCDSCLDTFLSKEEQDIALLRVSNEGYFKIKSKVTARATFYTFPYLQHLVFVKIKWEAAVYGFNLTHDEEEVYSKTVWKNGFIKKSTSPYCENFKGLFENLLDVDVKKSFFGKRWTIKKT